MSLLLTAAVVTGAVLVGRFFGRRAQRQRVDEAVGESEGIAGAGQRPSRTSASQAEPPPAARRRPQPTQPKKPAGDPLAAFPCHLGDVLMVHGGEEAWLAGALVFYESLAAAALFVAPDAGHDRAVLVRPSPSPSLVWLEPVAASELSLGAEPPSTLEHKGERFERLRRVPYRVERAGTGAPDVGDQAVVAEYASGGERLVVIAGSGSSRAWRGNVLEEGTYDILPSGKSTLE